MSALIKTEIKLQIYMVQSHNCNDESPFKSICHFWREYSFAEQACDGTVMACGMPFSLSRLKTT